LRKFSSIISISKIPIRRICRQCIESRDLPSVDEQIILAELKKQNKKRNLTKRVYYGKGCKACSMTGYSGRMGIFEILIIDENLRNVINSENVSTDKLNEAAAAQGMKTMFEDALDKIEQGITTPEEVFRAIRE